VERDVWWSWRAWVFVVLFVGAVIVGAILYGGGGP
jgi:hypothetical protein